MHEMVCKKAKTDPFGSVFFITCSGGRIRGGKEDMKLVDRLSRLAVPLNLCTVISRCNKPIE